MQKTIIAFFFIMFLALHPRPALSADSGEPEAILAAEVFLHTLDAGDYEQGWQMTSLLHQARTYREHFVPAVTAIRSSFGNSLARVIRHLRELDSAPTLPDGEYIYISFESSFEKKKAATETVFLRLEEDGNWRVCEYRVN